MGIGMSDFRSLTLYVIRHGECEHNVEGRFAGQNDSPLTAAGRGHGHENGLLLKGLIGEAPRQDFIASPLHRACATMDLVRAAAGLPMGGYRADHRLMELDLGDHSGWLIANFVKTADHAAYSSDPWNYVRPNGESHARFYRRIGDFMATLTRDSVLVCHAGSVRMIRAHYLNLSFTETMNYEPPHTGFMQLSMGAEQRIAAGKPNG
jgi:broad specificity phosphatase PhoE